MPFGAIVESLGCGELYATERTTVDIAFHFQDPADEGGIADTHSHAPSWHVVAFRHRVKLYAAVFRSWYLHERHRFVVEYERVRIVVHHHNAVSLCEIHESFVCLASCVAASRHVWVVGPHEFHFREVHLLQLFEVRLPSVVFHEVVVHHLCPEYFAERGVGRISWVRHEHLFARIDECECNVQNAFLRPDEWLHLVGGIDIHLIPSFVESRYGVAQLGCSHGGLVSVRVVTSSHLTERVDRLF